MLRPLRRTTGPTGQPLPDLTMLMTTKGQNRYSLVSLHFVARAGRVNGFSKSHWLVFITILSHMNKEQGCAWPSYARIGTIINRSAETVRRAVRDLVKWEFLQMEKVTGRPNRYYQMHQLVGENDWQEGGR